MMKPRVHLIVCDHFAAEARVILGRPGFEKMSLGVFPSLGDRVPASWTTLLPVLAEAPEGAAIHILGGACLKQLGPPPRNANPCHVHGFDQSFHIVAPPAFVDGCIASREFLTTPGWLQGWRHILDQWGLDRRSAREMFQESSVRIRLLDTGVLDDAATRLDEFADFTGLPGERTPIGLEHMELRLRSTAVQAALDAAEVELRSERHERADLAVLLDTLQVLGDVLTEEELVEKLRTLMTMLFGGSTVCYLPVHNGEPSETARDDPCGQLLPRYREQIQRLLEGGLPFLEVPSGFLLRLEHNGSAVGLLLVENLAFPEYRQRYLALAHPMAGTFGLALTHARLYDQLRLEREEIGQGLRGPVWSKGDFPTMCSGCKKILDDRIWRPVDEYLLERSGFTFSHGLCPECMKKYYPRFRQDLQMETENDGEE